MNYKLALKLKNAGFSTRKENNILIDKRDGWIAPTLSDLIEACGERFKKIWFNSPHLGGSLADRLWYAEGWGVNSANGSTPEDAVANLWLSIKNHEN